MSLLDDGKTAPMGQPGTKGAARGMLCWQDTLPAAAACRHGTAQGLTTGTLCSVWSFCAQLGEKKNLKKSRLNKIEREYFCACSCAMTRGFEVNF